MEILEKEENDTNREEKSLKVLLTGNGMKSK